MDRARTPAPPYRYTRRLIIEAGRQTMPPRLTPLAGSALAQYQLTAAVGY